MRAACVVAFLTAVGVTTAVAQDMRNPRITRITAEWDAVAGKLNEAEGPAAAPEVLARLNRTTASLFADIFASPIPVLLPFNSADFLRDRAAGNSERAVTDYLIDFKPPQAFLAGPGGYDAEFSFYPKDVPALGVSFFDRVDVLLSGSAFFYDLDEPAGMINWPTKELDAEFPGIRRVYLEGYVRYTFTRYSVPYVISIECREGGSRYRKISCRDADKVAARMLRDLQVAGGAPPSQPEPAAPNTIARPEAASTVFTYHSPGSIMPGSGMKGRAGRADYTVYSKMRFPLADAPAYANSQSFMNWGDCDQTGRVSIGRNGNAPAYRCRVNGVPLVADELANYAYPWRDNFCEHRYFFVGDCPGGLGHQGQDIRPSSCKQRILGANRCEPYQHDVVASRDGIVLRAPGQFAFYVLANTENERVRFRYLHLNPKTLDQDGVLSGRVVHEGEVLGKVGNFFRRERATTYHLHFDMQVPSKYGWVFVNPYMSLVAAYERQIRGRGRELQEDGTPYDIAPIATSITPVANPPANGTPAADRPVAEAPGAEAPVAEMPVADAPTAEVPATEIPEEPRGPIAPVARLPDPETAVFNRRAKDIEYPVDPDGEPLGDPPAITAANPDEMDVDSEANDRFEPETAVDDRKDPEEDQPAPVDTARGRDAGDVE